MPPLSPTSTTHRFTSTQSIRNIVRRDKWVLCFHVRVKLAPTLASLGHGAKGVPAWSIRPTPLSFDAAVVVVVVVLVLVVIVKAQEIKVK
ncbi:hypothetical protein O3P69_005845 [Scylla paramamosain]|uniref:Uncharacterized protein n=1 Tax=Scylla paramamosain TaxID=85552 RepID=A0AAW0U5U9_SCYPA